jgi:phosphatidylglycerophosphate synthase
LKAQKETYYSNQLEFEKQELVRMQKVNKNVPNIIIGLSVLIILILLVFMFFIKSSLWQGVTFSILIYLLGLLIFESISYISVKNYLQSLLT